MHLSSAQLVGCKERPGSIHVASAFLHRAPYDSSVPVCPDTEGGSIRICGITTEVLFPQYNFFVNAYANTTDPTN